MKALVNVIFRTAEQHGRKSDPVSQGKDNGLCYRPCMVIEGGNGNHLDIQFNDQNVYIRGERYTTEIESILDDMIDYSEIKTGKKFVICEGGSIVGDGRILATSPATKED